MIQLLHLLQQAQQERVGGNRGAKLELETAPPGNPNIPSELPNLAASPENLASGSAREEQPRY